MKDKIIMKCERYKRLYPNILFTMISEKVLKEVGYVSNFSDTKDISLIYGSVGQRLNTYAYLDKETNDEVIKLRNKISRINKKITKIIQANEDKLIPMTLEDVKRLKLRGIYDKTKQ